MAGPLKYTRKKRFPDKKIQKGGEVCLHRPVGAHFMHVYAALIGFLLLLLCKAFAAIYGSVFSGLEGYFRLGAAGGAGGGEVLSIRPAGSLSGRAAFFASLGFVLETLFRIELLLARCEYEFLSAFFANECLVFVHVFPSLKDNRVCPGRNCTATVSRTVLLFKLHGHI